jgi:hypothetical protein
LLACLLTSHAPATPSAFFFFAVACIHSGLAPNAMLLRRPADAPRRHRPLNHPACAPAGG